jgi:serine protease Do
MKKIIGVIMVAMATSVVTIAVAKKYFYPNMVFQQNDAPIEDVKFANYAEPITSPDGGYVNLEEAAERSSKAVVHIKTETKARTVQYRSPFGDDFFDQFFGGRQYYQQAPQQSSGSGVIVTADGYIVTNNHVVDAADQVTVILNNKKSYPAKVIGKDPSSDLAVLKISENNLPTIPYGNSDEVKLGQWVLAVGYPLTLETTVTAGIVSAKYRNIGINQSKSGSNAIESFIQTDAAVNPGNSGGALVNSRGELVGINSAIASPTGSYAGYSFAIPSNIVRKIVTDMIKYGNVQRAYLGVGYVDTKNATPEQISALKLDKVEGVYVSQVYDESSAEEAGIKEGDFITRIGNKAVKTGPEMTEQIAQFRPGDNTTITYFRNGKEYTSTVNFKNKFGNTDIVKQDVTNLLGLTMRPLTKQESQSLRVNGGLYISDIKAGGLISKQTRMKKTFIITQVNDKDVTTTLELDKILNSGEKEFQLGGIYPNFQGVYYYMVKLD